MQASKNLVTDYASNLAAAGASGTSVFIPPGTYNFTAFTMVSGTRFVGSGRGTSVLNCTSSTGTIIMGDASTNPQNIGLYDLSITSGTGTGAMLACYNAFGTDFINIALHVPGKVAIDIGGGDNCFATTFNKVKITSAGIGIQLGVNTTGKVQDVFMSEMVIGGCTAQSMVVQQVSGLYMQSMDLISAGDFGIAITPPSGKSCVAIFMTTVLFDTCGNHGLYIKPSGTGVVQWVSLTNCWAATMNNQKDGFYIDVPPSTAVVGNIMFNNVEAINNQGNGFNIQGGNDIQMNGCMASANARVAQANMFDGLVIGAAANNVCINGGTYGGKDSFPQNQRYGINNASNTTRFRGAINTTNNMTGQILNTSTSLL
jgi:hypothetical protein